MPKKKIVWNRVTTFSKILAMALFILMPFLGFILGMKYQHILLLGY